MKGPRIKRVLLSLFCGSVAVAGMCFFLFKLQYDNKYASWPQARLGVLDYSRPAEELVFLWDGWEFYPGQFLTPETIRQGAAEPDYIYIGEYGGFELGDPAAPHGGYATYRLTILTAEEREYALEVPYIFGDYRLWVNGQLRRSSGGGGTPYLAVGPVDGRIEIVLAVEADGLLYDGLVYPPAFGSSRAVWGLLQIRSLLSAAACGCALFLAGLYLYVGIRARRERLALAFALLSICYCVSILRFPLLAMGLSGNTVLIFCRVCYYGIFLALMSILVDVLEINQAVSRAALTVGTLMCAWVLAFQLFGLDGSTRALRFFGSTTEWYKFAVAAFLMVVPVVSALRRRPHALPLLAGGIFLASALVADRLFPGYEPALIQWPVETAAMVQIGVIAWVLISDAVLVYGDNIRLGAQKRAAQGLAAEQAKQYAVLARHLDEFSRARHDMRALLISLQHKCRQGEYRALEDLLEQSLGAAISPMLTSNSLVSAIFSVLIREAEAGGVMVHSKFGPLPACLDVEDTDLCVLLTNLFHNAMEACSHVPEGGPRHIEFSLRYEEGTLYFKCSNTFAGPLSYRAGQLITTKRERGHGLGLKIAGEIAEKYGGTLSLRPWQGIFEAIASIHC